jgi:excisionase family DNA binding protein
MTEKMDNSSQKPQFYTVEEIAEILKLTVRTIYEYISSGKLEAYKIGKHYRIKPIDLDRFITSGKLNKKS